MMAGKIAVASGTRPMSLPLARLTVMAQASISAEQTAIASPKKLPLFRPS